MNLSERIYNLGIHLGLPLGIAAGYRALLNRQADQQLSRRFLINPPASHMPRAKLWLHGASVGEMKLVRILRDWARESLDLEQILVTAGTLSGLRTLDHPRTELLPMDYPALLRPFINRLDQAPLVIVETEIWPNLYRLAPGPLYLYNGHLKPDSFSRYTRWKSLVSTALSRVDQILARSSREARQFRVLCEDRDAPVQNTGNMKWIPLADKHPRPQLAGPRFSSSGPVFVAGSTWPGEEQPVLRQTKRAGLHTYLAPRHLDRLPDVEQTLRSTDLNWTCWSDAHGSVDVDVILVDVMGILADLYARADLCFVGGSWVDGVGGHDLLEPARFGIPISVGPHISNVSRDAEFLESVGQLRILESKGDWKEALDPTTLENGSEQPGPAPAVARRARRIKDRYQHHFQPLLDAIRP